MKPNEEIMEFLKENPTFYLATVDGYLPRVRVLHTSDKEQGQIYIPSVNWLMLLAVIALVSAFSALQLIAQGAQFGAGGWVFMASTTAGVLAARLWAQRIPQSWLQRGFALLVLLSMVLLRMAMVC